MAEPESTGPVARLVSIDVHAGRFTDQRLAYAHVLDACAAAGLSADLDHVEVILPGRRAVRLDRIFEAGPLGRITAALGAEEACILFPPAALGGAVLAADARMRPVGRFPGWRRGASAEAPR